MNKYWYLALSILVALLMIGIIYQLQNPRETKTTEGFKQEAVLMQDYQKSSFNKLPFDEQVFEVTKKYFSTCNEVSDFCKKHPYMKSCKESCKRFYFAWNVSENATLTSSISSTDFVQLLTKEAFDNFDKETKEEIINEGYFATCTQVLNYCLNINTTEGCKKYCGKYLLEPTIVADINNNGSQEILN